MGNACWELFCLEHGVGPDGVFLDSPAEANSREDPFNTFFNTGSSGRHVPRAIYVDLEPTVIGEQLWLCAFFTLLIFLIIIWGPIICGHKYQVLRISIHMSHGQLRLVSRQQVQSWVLHLLLNGYYVNSWKGNIQWIWAGKEHFLPLCLNLFPDFYCFIWYNCLLSLHWTVLKLNISFTNLVSLRFCKKPHDLWINNEK